MDSYACVVHILRIMPPTSLIIWNGTLPFRTTLSGKRKFVSDAFLPSFVHCFILRKLPVHILLSQALTLFFPTSQTHMLACSRKGLRKGPVAVCLSNSCDLCPSGRHLSMDCIGPWMSVQSCVGFHPSRGKQSDNRPEFNHRLSCSLALNPFHPAWDNLKRNFILSAEED